MAGLTPIDRIYGRVSGNPTYSISRSKVYRLVKDGRLTLHKMDGAALVKVADLEALIDGRA